MILITSSKLFQKNINFIHFDNLNKISIFGSLLLFSMAIITNSVRPSWLLVFIPVIVLHFFQKYKNNRNLTKAKQDNIFLDNDVFLSISTYPQPGTTLMQMLKAEGITCQDIKKLKLMTHSLQHGCDYYQEKMINAGYKINLIDNVDIYGNGNIKDKSKICNNFKLYPTNVVLTQHINIITTRDERCLVCYEPEHIVKDGKEKLIYGSFLVEVKAQNIDSIELKFNEIIKKAGIAA